MGGEVSRPSLRGKALSALAVSRPRAGITDRIIALGKDGLASTNFLVFREPEGPLGGLFGIQRPTELEHLDTLASLGVTIIITLLPESYIRSGAPPTARLVSDKPSPPSAPPCGTPTVGGAADGAAAAAPGSAPTPAATPTIAYVACDTGGSGSEWVELDVPFIDALDARFERIHLAIADGSAPPHGPELDASMRRVAAARAAGQSVAVHCWEGWGRTGMFAAAALCSVWGLPAAEALAEVVARNVKERSPFQTDARHAAAMALCGAAVRAVDAVAPRAGPAPGPGAPPPLAPRRLHLQERSWWDLGGLGARTSEQRFLLRDALSRCRYVQVTAESAAAAGLATTVASTQLAHGPFQSALLVSDLDAKAYYSVMCAAEVKGVAKCWPGTAVDTVPELDMVAMAALLRKSLLVSLSTASVSPAVVVPLTHGLQVQCYLLAPGDEFVVVEPNLRRSDWDNDLDREGVPFPQRYANLLERVRMGSKRRVVSWRHILVRLVVTS